MTATTRHDTTDASPHLDWRAFAACTQDDSDLFFPVGDNAPARQQARAAKQICWRCPVREACLDWALASRQDHGVWGGMTEVERRHIHRRRQPSYVDRRRSVADWIFMNRLSEFTGLRDRGLSRWEIAKAMGTNVQIVNQVLERIAASEVADQVVKAA